MINKENFGAIATALAMAASTPNAQADGLLVLGEGGIYEVNNGNASLVVPTDITTAQVRARANDVLLVNSDGYFRSREDLSGFDPLTIDGRTTVGSIMPLNGNDVIITDKTNDKVEIANIPEQGNASITASYIITDPDNVDSLNFRSSDGEESMIGVVSTSEPKAQKIWFFNHGKTGFVDISALTEGKTLNSNDLECVQATASVTCIMASGDTGHAFQIPNDIFETMTESTDFTSDTTYVKNFYVDPDFNGIGQISEDGTNIIFGTSNTLVTIDPETLEVIDTKEIEPGIGISMGISPLDGSLIYMPNSSIDKNGYATSTSGEDQPEQINNGESTLEVYAVDTSGRAWHTPEGIGEPTPTPTPTETPTPPDDSTPTPPPPTATPEEDTPTDAPEGTPTVSPTAHTAETTGPEKVSENDGKGVELTGNENLTLANVVSSDEDTETATFHLSEGQSALSKVTDGEGNTTYYEYVPYEYDGGDIGITFGIDPDNTTSSFRMNPTADVNPDMVSATLIIKFPTNGTVYSGTDPDDLKPTPTNENGEIGLSVKAPKIVSSTPTPTPDDNKTGCDSSGGNSANNILAGLAIAAAVIPRKRRANI